MRLVLPFCILIAGPFCAQGGTSGGGGFVLPAGFPPPEVWPQTEVQANTLVNESPKMYGEVRIEIKNKKVRLGYSMMETATGLWDVAASQSFSTSYWPNAACWLDADTLFVAGKARAGDTVIERWEFGATTHGTDPSGQQFITPGPRNSVSAFYSADTAGMKLVEGMTVFKGSANQRILVQFHDSRDVYVFDAATGAAQLQASPTDTSALVYEPVLNQDWFSIQSREHVSLGHAYIFERNDDVAGPGSPPILMLFDQDKNGNLETSLVVDDDLWAQLEFHKPASWVY